MATAHFTPMVKVHHTSVATGGRWAPEEAPIAIVHDAMTYAVMMATPADLEDFAIGLSLTEGVIRNADEVRGIDINTSALGIEVRLWLSAGRGATLLQRRRTMAGPTGCGLCGLESLEQMERPPTGPLRDVRRLHPDDIFQAMASLQPHQALGRQTRASHAAGLWTPEQGLVCVREDVGRHNAVDKMVGALARAEEGAGGVVLLTSRVSVELVQKVASLGAPVIAAVSAPTQLAIETAKQAGITLVAVVRDDGFEVFTHPERLDLDLAPGLSRP